jgi:hypothetical protein
VERSAEQPLERSNDEIPPRNDDAFAQALLDDDPPARVRKTFAWLTAIAGVVCLLPRQWVAAAICFAGTVGVVAFHLVASRREGRGSSS